MATHSNVLVLPASSESDESPAVINPSKGSASPPTVSYAQLAAITRSLQLDLAHAGITKASRVAILLPNGLEFVAVFLAIVRQRGIAAPLNPQYTQSEFKEIFSRMEPELVVMLPTTPDLDVSLFLEAPGVQAALALGVRVALCRRKCEAKGGVESELRLVLELLEAGDNNIAPTATIADAIVFSRNDVWSEDKALMLFTSGTTGAPKSVLLSHTNLLVAMRIIIANHRLSSADRTFIITPLYHIIGVCGSLLVTLFSGGCAVIPESLPGAFWRQCAEYGITWFHGVPTIHRLLLGFPRPGGCVPSQLRFLRCGGSEMPPDLHESLVALGPQLLEVYGMTETAPAIFCNRLTEAGDTGMRRRGHYPIPDAVDVMILPSEVLGREVSDVACNGTAAAGDPATKLTKEPGVTGEVCLRGKNVMDGYTNSPEANAEAFLSNGYFRTGDLGAIQPDGYLRLVGRIKEVINKGGTKIGPAEVEHVALSHASVAEAACFRIADNVYGDEIGLAVTLHPHLDGEVGPATATNLKRHIRQHLTAFKVPKKIVFVDAIPYNRTGKPMRTQLSHQFAKGLL